MSILKLKAVGSLLTLEQPITDLVSTQVNYDKFDIEFSPEWASYTKTAVFYTNPENKLLLQLTGSGPWFIPQQALLEAKVLYVGVFGVDGESNVLPTNFVYQRVAAGAFTDGETVGEPTPDVYTQLLAAYAGVQQISSVTLNDAGEMVVILHSGETLNLGYAKGDVGPQGPIGLTGGEGPAGPKGDPLTYADLTPEQLAALVGPPGPKGDPFTYADFTPEQLAALTGPQGPEGTQGKTGPEGPTGAAGADGADGTTPVKGTDYWTPADQAGILGEMNAIESVSAVAGTYTCDLTANFSKDFLLAATTAAAHTIVFSNVPTGRSEVFLELPVGSTKPTVTWTLNSGSTLSWAGGAAPTIVASKTYRLMFITNNGGTSWHGFTSQGV